MSHSIPDKEALSTIWQKVKDRSIPLKPLTKAEYDVLDETSKNADIAYLVQSADGLSLVYKGENLFSERGQSNLNLLDNWYFADPINQMGKTEYQKIWYAIDRWYFYAGASNQHTLAVGDECITLVCGGTDNPWIRQKLEGDFDPTQKVTLSVLAKSNEAGSQFALKLSNLEDLNIGTAIKYFTFSKSNQYELFSMTISSYMKTAAEIIGSSISGVSISVMAVKLELGSQQTLAQQDSDGNWLLNDPPPNKALELVKCQRYLCPLNIYGWLRIRSSGFDANWLTFSIPVPVTMRTKPVLVGDVSQLKIQSVDGEIKSGYTLSTDGYGPGWVMVLANKSDNDLNDAYLIGGSGEGKQFFDANL